LLATSFLGGCAALCMAALLAISSAKHRMKDYATEFLRQDDIIASEVSSALRQANVVQGEPCSDADMAMLRGLLFQSLYLKDVGRLDKGALVCSALGGRMPKPVRNRTDGQYIDKTHILYFNVNLVAAYGQSADVLEGGNANIVLSADFYKGFSRPPVLFAGALVDHATGKIVQTYTNSASPMPLNLITAGKFVRLKGMLYYPYCNAVHPTCVLIALPLRQVWTDSMGFLTGSFVLGIALGAGALAFAGIIERRNQSMSSQLRRALRKKLLSVVYQPIVDIRTGAIVSCEALVRWQDEDRQSIRPDIFVPVAEDAGFAGEITNFVVERVCQEMGDLLRSRPDFIVTINICATDLGDPTFPGRLTEHLASCQIPAQSIGLELTERVTAARGVVMDAIHALRRRGHRVYIDDFGTGYSSLSYLHELAVDVLKIDRAFTNTIGTESITASIVPQIISMAHALGLEVVVEGVEHAAQSEYLQAFEERLYGQGWFFSYPLSSAEIHPLLTEHYAPSGIADSGPAALRSF
jgi:sensor c-di-GMP phosphodiesterase-like protein